MVPMKSVFPSFEIGASAYDAEPSTAPTSMSTLSCRMSFLDMDTSPSTVPLSVPSCVMMPVRGARNPILSSCACAGIALAAATHSSGRIRVSLFIVGPLLFEVASVRTPHRAVGLLLKTTIHADALKEAATTGLMWASAHRRRRSLEHLVRRDQEALRDSDTE